MTNHGQTSTAASSDSFEKGRSVTEIAGTLGLDGASSTRKEQDEEALVTASDTTRSNEQYCLCEGQLRAGLPPWEILSLKR